MSHGHWLPGQSGNPAGRAPEDRPSIVALCRQYGPAGVHRLAEFAGLIPGEIGENHTVQLRAIIELLNRGYGMPKQEIVDADGNHFTFQHLIAARAVLIEINNQRAIEGSAVAAETNSHGSNGKSNGAAPHDLMEPADE